MGLGMIGLHMKDELFVISKNCLTLGGAVPSQTERILKMSKHHNIQKVNTHTHTHTYRHHTI